MGDCASRPNKKDIEEHTYQTNTTNNSSFISLPYVNTDIENEKNLLILESKRKFYYKKEMEYHKAIQNCKPGAPGMPELNVEVQKGVNFDSFSSCVNRGKPIIEIKLEPKGPKFQTFEGDPFKPYWYQIFKFKQSDYNYTHLTFALILSKKLTSKTVVGSLKFPMKDLQDQITRQGWFPITDGMDQSKLRLRIQFLHNQRLLYEELAGTCRARIQEIESSICLINEESD